MKGVKYNENNILKSLLSSTKNNLEQRVKELTEEIENRKEISNQILSSLGTAKIQIENNLWRLRYISMFNEAFIVNRDFMRQIMRIEEQISSELINNLQDNLKIKLKLQDIKEELELEKQKFKLLGLD